MQLVLIGLFIVLFGYDAGADGLPQWDIPAVWTPACVLGPKLLLLGVYAILCRRTRARLESKHAHRAHRRLERSTTFFTLALLPLFALDVMLGGLDATRAVVGDLVLLDEAILLLPTLAVMAAAWALYYPVDRALREALILRRLDEGQPIYPIWSRREFVVAQFRHQVLLMLIPLMVVYGWVETLGVLEARDLAWVTAYRPYLIAGGAGLVLAAAPLIIRHVWDTTPLPPGEVRGRLERLLQDYRVGVAGLLLWRTHGGMANAAVLGVLRPARFILLTDALLDQASAREVEAVMAHELAHVKHRHMFWMLAAAIGLAGALELGTYAALDVWLGRGVPAAWWQVAIIAGPALLAWVLGFGWVSRRAERQADTFATQHLSRGSTDGRITADAVDAMVDALQRVAQLNHIRTRRRDWRHGSIAWRQSYLRTLVGRPARRLPIDRLMLGVNVAALALVGFTVWWATRA